MFEILNTIAAIGTFLVIAATAIAAVVQLRHMRASNQLEGLLSVLARVEDANFNRWLTDTQRQLPDSSPIGPIFKASSITRSIAASPGCSSETRTIGSAVLSRTG